MRLWPARKPPASEARSAVVPGYPIVAGGNGYTNIDGGLISNAEQAIAIRAGADLIASICSELPLDVYSGKGPGKREVAMPSYLEDPAGDGYGFEDWVYQLVWSWAYRGNAYADKIAVRGNMITQASLFHPDCVRPQVTDRGDVLWYANGAQMPAGQLAHWRVNPVPGVVLGLSPIRAHASTIGINLASVKYGASWFDSGAHPTGMLKNTKAPIDGDKAKTVKSRFMEALRAGGREPVVMGNAWEWEQLQLNPEDSQMLETLQWSAADCARIFGPGVAEILGYETGNAMTYSNLQDRDIQLLKYTVNRWLNRVERVIFQFLPRPQWARFNRDALLQTNTLQRYQAHAIALGGKPWMIPAETRDIEDLGPLPAELEPQPVPTQLQIPTPPTEDENPEEEGAPQ